MPSRKKPNLLFVFDDQHRHSALAAYGNRDVRTPHFDRFAEQGRIFEQCISTCPISGPYRGILLSGRYPHASGVIDNEYALNPKVPTLAQALGKAGYRTGYIGKWHLGYGPYTEDKRHGFGYLAANNCEHAYFDVSYHENEKGPISIEGWAPEHETDLALRFMERHRKDDPKKPFALVLGWGPPHWPYDHYPKEFDTYDPERIELPPNVPVQMEAFARRELAHYYGNVSALDAQFGRLMAGLEQMKLAENTHVIFTSDHGDHLSSHGYGKFGDRWMHHSRRASKATPYAESIRVPFLVRGPGVPAGTRTDAILAAVDLMPTMLGLCGVRKPKGVQGVDRSGHVLGKDAERADSAYLQILGPGWPGNGKWVGFWRGVTTGRFTYARWLDEEQETLLFDNELDPWQMINLANRPETRALQEALEVRLKQWIEETKDPFETGPRDPKTGILQLGQRFTHSRYER